MIIQSSSINMSSQYRLIKEYSLKESLRIELPNANNNDQTDLSKTDKSKSKDKDQETKLSPELRMIKMLLEKLLGKKIKLIKLEDQQDISNQFPKKSANQNPQDNQTIFEYSRNERYYQSEKTEFYVKGVVQTEDGKNIEFSLKLNLNREFTKNQSISIGNAKTKDPLVINFNSGSVQLRDEKFNFDLDSDSQGDQIPFVDGNSGFLAIDLNKDNKINDGKELFGPTTGDGFAELKIYDEDNNDWIDEKDSVYKNLLVWTKSSEGQDSLTEIKKAGIGAIYLGHQSTLFEITDDQNITDGLLKSSGIYISETGTVGTIQQIDLIA
ncbi:TPA: hypothetical protein ENX78_09000 [Candidatus Poribacteria bacterium]|nr:hypothetical protein [Candidatus Poribacteria bacterium]